MLTVMNWSHRFETRTYSLREGERVKGDFFEVIDQF